MKNPKKLILPAIIVVILLVLVFSSFTMIPAGHSGVVVTLGKVEDSAMSSGLHFKIPFVQKAVLMNNKIQKSEVDSNSVSKDLQTVSSTVAVNFHISGDSAPSIYKNIGTMYEDTVLQPAIQESVKSITAQYTAEELITERSAVGDEISKTLSDKVTEYGVIIDKFNIVNFEFSAEFNAAIEQKQVAEQNYLKAQTEKQQTIMEAEADAEATLTRAAAEAEANNKINASLNEYVLKYLQIEKWDGKYPSVLSSDSSVLIDLPVSGTETNP